MHYRLLFPVIGAMFLILGGSPALANPCLITPEAQTATLITAANAQVQIRKPTVLQDCRNIRIQAGQVCIVSRSADLAGKRCRRFGPGESTDSDPISNPILVSLANSVLSAMAGQTRTGGGGMRARNTQEEVLGFPYGTVLAWPGDMPISTNLATSLGNIEEFAITPSGAGRRGARSLQISQGYIYIPTAMIRSGQRYEWAVRISGRVYNGSFRLVAPTENPAFLETWNALLNDPSLRGNAAALALLQAELLDQHGFSFDALRAMERALK